ncbi:ABC transporter ATP-binding protein [Robbsia andropogonis]|uniref:ABC transporter ATP-binding protein n=1 Tax=Robbsia andropogonis TaxID=28092 RepID=UPI0004B037C7|nr:ABC transporter ATP-binding protein [Robbsia andropogonis]
MNKISASNVHPVGTVHAAKDGRPSTAEAGADPGGTSPRLALRGISKRYPLVRANDGVDLTVQPGEIHAVVGENGAGKSTLMKIVYGAVQPDSGGLFWDGEPVTIGSPAAARRLGIGMVFQHFALFETLTVAQNIALALEAPFDLPSLSRRIARVSQDYGLDIAPQRHIHALTVGERQRVEIVRCLLQSPRLLIMDEPTSVLAPQAVEKLFSVLRRLAAEGCSILYISHKLDEVRTLCHRATVMRGGKVTGVVYPAEHGVESLASLMVGRDIPAYRRAGAHERLLDKTDNTVTRPVALRVRHLNVTNPDPFGAHLQDVTLSLHAGEILGIAGISGNGQAELLAALSGEKALDRNAAIDTIQLCGKPISRAGVKTRRAQGLAYVPEERLGRGAVPAMSLTENAALTDSADRSPRMLGARWFGRFRRSVARACAARWIDEFDVRCGGPNALAQSLSGGNLQKFIVGRELTRTPRVLLVAQPTWGVDIGAATLIRQRLLDMAAQGTAILLVSEELSELFALSDRIAVIAAGRLTESYETAATSPEEIGQWMTAGGSR